MGLGLSWRTLQVSPGLTSGVFQLNPKFPRTVQIKWSCKNDKSGLFLFHDGFHDGFWYFCKQCDYKALDMNTLKRHVEQDHQGVFHTCQQCNFKGTTKSSIQQHVKYVHDSAVYQCSKCNFKGKHIKRHMNSMHCK